MTPRALELHRVRSRRWREKHRAALVEYYRAYRATHPELRTYHADYYRTVTRPNKPAKPARPVVSAEARRARKQLKDAKWRQRHPEQYAESIRRSKAKRPDLYRQIAVNSALARRTRKRQLVTERVSLKRIRARDRNICHLCGKGVEKATFDHLIPVVRGGAHAEWNLMVAHDHCNKSRGTKQILPEETKAAAETYIAKRRAEVAA